MNGVLVRPVTARDVAEAARVSQTTVSFVINSTPNKKISQETRDRVLSAALELGYTPSQAARTLVKGRSNTVLLILPRAPLGAIGADLLNILTDQLAPAGLSLVTTRLGPGQSIEDLWLGLAPISVISLESVSEDEQTRMRRSGILPIVFAMRESNQSVGRMQVEYLATKGHRALGFAFPCNMREQETYAPRAEGVLQACRAADLPDPVEIRLDLDIKSAIAALGPLKQRHPEVSGICAYNDDYAFALLAGMAQLGLTTRDDLAIIGVDNIKPAQFANPALTTIDPNLPDLLVSISKAVIDIAAGGPLDLEAPTGHPRLIVRESA